MPDVLIVEDEPLLRTLICESLEASIDGLQARTASSRREASAILEHVSVDQVVSEVYLGGVNISSWLASTLARRPMLSLVSFSTSEPWLPVDLREDARVAFVDKRDGVASLIETCRQLLE